MKALVVVHPDRPEARYIADQLAAAAADRGITVTEAGSASMSGVDVVVSVGGDGTLLRAAALARAQQIPILGIDVGIVGYLAEVDPAQIEAALDRLAAGSYRVVERMTVEAVWEGSNPTVGVNDVVVEKVTGQHAVQLKVEVDGARLIIYRADGVVVATPLGSTAYSYSAGGPVVHPDLEAIVVSAVASHNLFSRSLVLSPDSTVGVEVMGGRPARINIDGREAAVLEPGQRVEVRRGAVPVRFAVVFEEGFADQARRKFKLDDA